MTPEQFEQYYFSRVAGGARSAQEPDPALVEDAFTRLEGVLRHYKKLPDAEGR